MEKTYVTFKRFILLILVLSALSIVFGAFSLVHYYDSDTISIQFKNVIPIFSIVFAGLTVIAFVVLTIKTPNLHIKRLKRDSGFSKFAAALAAALVTALFLFDFIRFISPSSSLMTIKIIRLPVSIPFIVYFVLELIPSKFKRKRISIPDWLPTLCSICAVAWCVIGALSIYFWSALPITNFFKISHMLYYILGALFFLSDFAFNHLGQGHRLYIFTTCSFFALVAIFTGSTAIGKFTGLLPNMGISQFELVTALSLGVFALSKLIAIPYTLKYVMKKEGRSGHHHHHHSRTSKQKADSGVAKSSIPTDIDI